MFGILIVINDNNLQMTNPGLNNGSHSGHLSGRLWIHAAVCTTKSCSDKLCCFLYTFCLIPVLVRWTLWRTRHFNELLRVTRFLEQKTLGLLKPLMDSRRVSDIRVEASWIGQHGRYCECHTLDTVVKFYLETASGMSSGIGGWWDFPIPVRRCLSAIARRKRQSNRRPGFSNTRHSIRNRVW